MYFYLTFDNNLNKITTIYICEIFSGTAFREMNSMSRIRILVDPELLCTGRTDLEKKYPELFEFGNIPYPDSIQVRILLF